MTTHLHPIPYPFLFIIPRKSCGCLTQLLTPSGISHIKELLNCPDKGAEHLVHVCIGHDVNCLNWDIEQLRDTATDSFGDCTKGGFALCAIYNISCITSVETKCDYPCQVEQKMLFDNMIKTPVHAALASNHLTFDVDVEQVIKKSDIVPASLRNSDYDVGEDEANDIVAEDLRKSSIIERGRDATPSICPSCGSYRVGAVCTCSHSPPFQPLRIVVLIDGDGMIFLPKCVALGRKGGLEAGTKLAEQIHKQYVLHDEPLSMWMWIYFNKRGLANAFNRAGYDNITLEVFNQFALGLMDANVKFDVVDTGPGKEAADHKIKGTF